MKIDLIKRLNTNNINISGYAFLLGILYEAVRNNAKIKETPITFMQRIIGELKMGPKDIMQFFITCFKFRFNK